MIGKTYEDCSRRYRLRRPVPRRSALAAQRSACAGYRAREGVLLRILQIDLAVLGPVLFLHFAFPLACPSPVVWTCLGTLSCPIHAPLCTSASPSPA